MKTYLDKLLTCVMTPASWIYGAVVWTRNKMFDAEILKEKKYPVPIIGVGNITVGGTGKTPHVEYIASRLSDHYNIAVLSRGYKRKTKGYILATNRSTPEQIGDEPMQIYRKLGHKVKVAVCENRQVGIETLLDSFPEINLIILDDSFQHRWVRPKVSIMLQDYNRPIKNDKLIPLGRLREQKYGIYRADMVVVTKCPDQIDPIDYRLMVKDLDLLSYQKVYFSSFRYMPVEAVFPENEKYNISLETLSENDSVLLVTGIAYPRMFIRHFKQYPFKIKVLRFPDHHEFTRNDIKMIEDAYSNQQGRRKIIVTTEKDAVRMAYNPYYPDHLKPITYYQPVEVRMKYGLNGEDFISDLEYLLKQ